MLKRVNSKGKIMTLRLHLPQAREFKVKLILKLTFILLLGTISLKDRASSNLTIRMRKVKGIEYNQGEIIKLKHHPDSLIKSKV